MQVGWKRRHTIDRWSVFAQNPFHLFLPCHFIPGKTHLQTPRPIKDKTAFKQFSSQLPQRLKQQKHLYNFLYWPALLSPVSYDTICMCSLTAVYINQYIYQTAAAYCVCRFEWAKDTKGVSMLCKKKGHLLLFSVNSFLSSSFYIYLGFPFNSSPTLNQSQM